MFVHGRTGTGKTCGAGLCVIDHWGGWYLTAAELCRLLFLAQRHGGEPDGNTLHGSLRTVEQVWEDWRGLHVAVLDEVGARPDPSSPERLAVQKAIDERKGQAIVVISNYSLDALAARCGNPIVSRLSAGTRVELIGPDRRPKRENK